MKIIVSLIVVLFAFVAAQSRVLDVWGVSPNLILVVFVLLAFFSERLPSLLWPLSALAVFVGFFYPWWLFQTGAALLLAFAFYFLKERLTGVYFLDFLILVALGTILFYLIVNLFSFALIPPRLIFVEILYNLILGAILWTPTKSIWRMS